MDEAAPGISVPPLYHSYDAPATTPEVSATKSPGQIEVLPTGVITEVGAEITVTTVVVLQPVGSVYVIPAVPAAIPLSTPVPETIGATAEALLLHVPPDVVLVSDTVVARQTVVGPPIAAGSGFTVNTRVRKHPVGSV